MTFTEIKELLHWSRTNRVAQLKIGAALVETNETRDIVPTVDVTFYPDAPVAALPIQSPTVDWRSQADQDLFGMRLEGDKP